MALDDLSLVIGGDIGPLEDALNSVPAVAQQAAANIDAALASIGDEGSAASAGIAQLSDALNGMWQGDWSAEAQQFDTALQGVGDSAGAAVPPLHDAGDAAHHAAESAQEAGTSFESLSESLIHVLEKLGLMITAWEAVKAIFEGVATEQAFTVSMAALTGSMETAEQTLKDLEATALELPVAFDSLLQATQRMQAFGVETEKIPAMLQAAADAAAATGNAFDAVAGGLERVMVTGQVMARSLMQMGVTWKQVADDMGVSIEQAQAAFKKGAQSAEEDVRILVDTIEKNYAGMSEKLAGTIGGSFQILKNQLTELAGDIGQIVAPIAQALMSTIGQVVEGWITIFVTLREVIGTIADAFSGLGPAVAQVADEMGKLLMITGALLIAFGASGWGLVVAAIGLVAEALATLSGNAADAADQERKLADVQAYAASAQKDLQFSADKLAQSLAQHGIIIPQLSKSTAEWSAQLRQTAADLMGTEAALKNASAIYSAFGDLMKGLFPTFDAFKQAIQDHLDALKKTGDSAVYTAIVESHQKLQQAATNAAQALKVADQMLADGTMKLAEHQAYVDANTKAQAALSDQVVRHTAVAKLDTQAITDEGKAIELLAKLLDAVNTDSAFLGNSFKDFADNVQIASLHLDPMTQKFLDIQRDIDNATKSQKEMTQAERDGLEAAQEKLNVDMAQAAEAAILADSQKFFNDQLQNAASIAITTAGVMKQLWIDVLQPQKDAEAEQERINQGLQMLGVTARRAGDEFKNAFDAFNAMAITGSRSLDEVTNAAEKLATSIAKTVEQQQKIVDLLQRTNQPIQIQLDAEAKLLDMKMKEAQYTDMTGESELRLQMAIEGVRLKQWAVHELTMAMADTFATVSKELAQVWNNIGQSISQALFTGQNFGQAMMNMVKQLAEKITGDLIQGALNDLAAHLLKDSGLLENFSGVVTKTTGDISKSVDNAAKAMDDFSATTDSTMKSATASVTQAGSSMIATFDLIATAIGAIASIFSAIELMHTNTLLSRIEESTRRLDITTEQGIWPAVQHLPDYLQAISNTLDGIHSDTFNSMTELGYIAADIHGMNAAIMTGGFGGGGSGGGTQGMSAQIADALASMNLMIDSLQRQIGTSGTGTPLSYVILGGGGGGSPSMSIPSMSSTLPSGGGGAFTPSASSLTPSGPSLVVNVSLSAGVVAGSGGMQQLSDMVSANVVNAFRGAGMKI